MSRLSSLPLPIGLRRFRPFALALLFMHLSEPRSPNRAVARALEFSTRKRLAWLSPIAQSGASHRFAAWLWTRRSDMEEEMQYFRGRYLRGSSSKARLVFLRQCSRSLSFAPRACLAVHGIRMHFSPLLL
jgi:hypothetical protein